MIKQIQKIASETPLSLLRASLLAHKYHGLQRNILIPDDLIASIEEYIERNNLAENDSHTLPGELYWCPHCLCAHIKVKSKEFGLDEESIEYLLSLFGEEYGHHGYYMDAGKLIKID